MPRTEIRQRAAIAALDKRWAAPTAVLLQKLQSGPGAIELREATSVVDRLRAVPERGDILPAIGAAAADAIVAVLEAHPAASLTSRPDVGLQMSAAEVEWSAAILAAGALALGQTGRMDDGLFDALVSVAIGGASRADLLTRYVLTGGRGIDLARPIRPDVVDLQDRIDELLSNHSITELMRAGCISALKSASAGLAGSLTPPPPKILTIPPVTGCTPNHGRPRISVVLSGIGWPAVEPTDVQVVFRSNAGTIVRAVVTSWSTSAITVVVPRGVGVGPVGFMAAPIWAESGVTSGLAMASAIEQCLGAAGGPIGDRLAHFVPPAAKLIPPGLQPGDVNLFIGGPQITAVHPPAAHVGDTVTITGYEFASGDRVWFENIGQPATFVSSISLTAVVPAIQGGRRRVVVGTPTDDSSNALSVQVLPTLSSLSRPGAKVNDSVQAKGTGFDSGAVVTLDGMAVPTTFFDPQTLEFIVRRPPQPFGTAVGGDDVKVMVQNPDGAAAGPLPLLVQEHTIVVFGDSIAWGQGLLTSQKFGDLVASRLQAGYGSSERIGAPIYLAHSGAIIGIEPPAATLPASIMVPAGVRGEIPADQPNAHEQVTAAGDPPRLGGLVPNDVRTVIVVAGMNSVSIYKVLNPSVTHAELTALSKTVCVDEMTTLLEHILRRFGSARIVVCGYYPIVSEQSDLALLMGVLSALGLVVLPAALGLVPIIGTLFGPIGVLVTTYAGMEWAKGVVISNCAFAAATMQADLARAVREVNLATPGKDRIAIAALKWAPEHSVFAPDPWVFGLGVVNGQLTAEDPMVAARAAVCGGGPVHCPIASLGHPNAKGAMAYADAIQAALSTLT